MSFVAALITIAFAYIVQSAFGFAGTVVVMPILLLLVGHPLAVALMGALGFLACGSIALQERKYINYRELLNLLPAMLVGMILGGILQSFAEFDTLKMLYAISIMAVSVPLFLTGGNLSIPNWLLPFLLILAGVLHAVLVCGGPLLVLVTIQRIPEKRRFRATISLIWVGTNLLLILQHYQMGFYTQPFFHLMLPGILMMAIGIVIGNHLHNRVDQQRFMKIGSALLFLSAGCMLL